MIHPDLRGPRGQLHATMLVFIMTDANIRSGLAQRALEWVADKRSTARLPYVHE